MKLYHGTTAAVARKAMVEGIRPRGDHGRSNWQRTVESNPRGVYLTDAYPLYFAVNAGKGNEALAVIEVDTDLMQQFFLVPDEDVLEQAGRKHDNVKGDMKKRTRYYRAQQHKHICSDTWKKSLEAMGTCTYLGVIPPEAITRVAFIDPTVQRQLCFEASDAMITLVNYRFCGPKYRNITRRIFGEPTEPDPLFGHLGDTLNEADLEKLGDQSAAIRQIQQSRKAYNDTLAQECASIEIVDCQPAVSDEAA